MIYTIEKITTLIGARRIGHTDAKIGWLLTDSRSLCFPEETLFFALRSQRNDGHRYIEDLYRRGVRNFVVEHSSLISHLSSLTSYEDARGGYHRFQRKDDGEGVALPDFGSSDGGDPFAPQL